MEGYVFLFIVGILWIVFAVVQDLRTREVSNWLNFSLIALVLAYRGFYGLINKDLMFFIYGVVGVILFIILAYGFYYGRVFAGGDAKLMMGLGGVLPFEGFMDFLIVGGGFIFLIFLSGVIWTLFFSGYLVYRNKKKFVNEFKKELKKDKTLVYVGLLVSIGIIMFGIYIGEELLLIGGLLVLAIPTLYLYVKALEKSCMIVLKDPKDLTEGDWLERDVKLGNKTIKKTVHGLSLKEIKMIRKAKKKIWIKEGVPFTPAFLIAILIFIWVFSNSSILNLI